MLTSEIHKILLLIFFMNLGNGREDENGCRYTTFGFDHEKKISEIFF